LNKQGLCNEVEEIMDKPHPDIQRGGK